VTGVALVTGAAGQDGSYLVDRLAQEGYAVHAAVRSAARLAAVPDVGVVGHVVDLADASGLSDLVERVEPTVIFNLGGVSSVAQSWVDPIATAKVSGEAALTLLESAWRLQQRSGREVRLIQASSAEVFGQPETSPQDESTPLRPVSPYGAAKAFAQHCVDVYRGRGLPASSLVLYNHESPRRPPTFVTRKISQGVARIAREGAGTLRLGNLDARRDWAWAPDVVDAILRAHEAPPDTYVIATGAAHSVRDFVAAAFRRIGVEDWARHVQVDPSLLRPADPSLLVGDASRARQVLGWEPTKSFEEIVAALVDADLADLADGRATDGRRS
jgi:GDPmannose 4,6-dehydratase